MGYLRDTRGRSAVWPFDAHEIEINLIRLTKKPGWRLGLFVGASCIAYDLDKNGPIRAAWLLNMR